MKQGYLADAVAGAPPSTGAASIGNPSDGDPANGVEATALGAYALYQLFTELEAVIDRGWPDRPTWITLTQVRDAILAMIAASGFDEAAGDARYLRQRAEPGRREQRGHCTGQTSAPRLLQAPRSPATPRAPTQGDRVMRARGLPQPQYVAEPRSTLARAPGGHPSRDPKRAPSGQPAHQ